MEFTRKLSKNMTDSDPRLIWSDTPKESRAWANDMRLVIIDKPESMAEFSGPYIKVFKWDNS
jgi:hypothetical protein